MCNFNLNVIKYNFLQKYYIIYNLTTFDTCPETALLKVDHFTKMRVFHIYEIVMQGTPGVNHASNVCYFCTCLLIN